MKRFTAVLLATTFLVGACSSSPEESEDQSPPEATVESGGTTDVTGGGDDAESGSYTVMDVEGGEPMGGVEVERRASDMDRLGIWRMTGITDAAGDPLPPFDEHTPVMAPAIEFDTIGGVTIKVGCSLITATVDDDDRFTLLKAEPLAGCPGPDKPTRTALVNLLKEATYIGVTNEGNLVISGDGGMMVGHLEPEVWTEEDMESV